MNNKIDNRKLKHLFGVSSYHALHTNLRNKYGKATHCSNKDCNYPNPKRFEWALKKGREYSLNIEDYIRYANRGVLLFCLKRQRIFLALKGLRLL